MTLEQQGAYVRLLCYNWQDGFIPNDLSQLALLCGTTPRKMALIWESVKDCFGPLPDNPDRLVNPRLEHTRDGLRRFSDKQKAKADARWESHGITKAGNATALPQHYQERHDSGNAFQSSVFSLQSSTSKEEEEGLKPLSAEADAKATKYPSDFEMFWANSTRRGSKLEAYRAWKLFMPGEELFKQILRGMMAWRESEQWQDETKQPHICRWLKRRGWEEIVPRSNANARSHTTKTDRNAEAARRLLSRLDSQDRSSGWSGDIGSDASDIFGTITPIERE